MNLGKYLCLFFLFASLCAFSQADSLQTISLEEMARKRQDPVAGPRINLAAPDGAKAAWGWRAVLIFLFPT